MMSPMVLYPCASALGASVRLACSRTPGFVSATIFSQ